MLAPLIAFILTASTIAPADASNELGLVPRPTTMQIGTGRFELDANTLISTDGNTRAVGETLRSELSPGTGLPLDLTSHIRGNMIVLRLDSKLSGLGDEGYRLDVDSGGVRIWAYRPAGIFYGGQTLRQLLPPTTYRQAAKSGQIWSIPSVHIEDKPRFGWRGAMLDVCRHFMPKEFLFRFVDLLAVHKLNVFHLHLTDDQGWRIQIKKYPKLTEIGAWHKANKLTDDPTSIDTMPDGGFYTQDDLRELVAYARERFVTVVPEIEMPGHSMAAIAAYPELGNTLEPVVVPGVNEPAPDVLNVGPKTVEFYQDVLTEVMDIFPSKFIHIGGDEVQKEPWQKNPAMQAQEKDLGLKDEQELQSWYVRQMDKFLADHGRRLLGWDEILEGGLAQGATVMSWRGIEGGIAAAKSGHDVVMAPTDFTYLDYYQSKDHRHEPRAIGGYVPLKTVYGYEPIPTVLTADQGTHVLGTQCQLWTEYIPNSKHVEYMAFPRLCAISEVGWSPKDGKNYDEFLGRLQFHTARLKALNVNYHPLGGE